MLTNSTKRAISTLMRRLHRIFAVLLLLIFVPATVLAGPLMLCMGQDGHRMVEFAHGPDHHAGLYDGQGSLDPVASSEGKTSCVDFALVSESTAAQQGAHHNKTAASYASDPPAVIVPLINFQIGRQLSVRPPLLRDFAVLPDASMAALRTVILLI